MKSLFFNCLLYGVKVCSKLTYSEDVLNLFMNQQRNEVKVMRKIPTS